MCARSFCTDVSSPPSAAVTGVGREKVASPTISTQTTHAFDRHGLDLEEWISSRRVVVIFFAGQLLPSSLDGCFVIVPPPPDTVGRPGRRDRASQFKRNALPKSCQPARRCATGCKPDATPFDHSKRVHRLTNQPGDIFSSRPGHPLRTASALCVLSG
jgi:hypothetical protein